MAYNSSFAKETKCPKRPKIALCPHCGHDEFRVNDSENKTVRLVGLDDMPHVKEEVLDTDGREYAVVVCCGCGADLNPREWENSALPAEA